MTGAVEIHFVLLNVPDGITPGTLNLGSANGVFTGVNGVITAHFKIPDGYTPDGEITLKTPLTTTLFTPVSSNVDDAGKTLVAQFNKADIDNDIPEGDAVPLVLTANFISGGVQKQLSSTALVKVVK